VRTATLAGPLQLTYVAQEHPARTTARPSVMLLMDMRRIQPVTVAYIVYVRVMLSISVLR
jgi:hypothetical protein